MRLPVEFVKLPWEFDHRQLAEEISRFDETEWRAHPQGFEGNSSLILVSTEGEENDFYYGPMKPAPRLERAPLIRQVMGSFNTVIGRSRLMRLAPGASVLEHTDANYFWRNHLRIHIPIVTDPAVSFRCGEREVHMAAGESWTFDNWRRHSVANRSDTTRIHLVIDTVGSAELWRLIGAGGGDARLFPFQPESEPELQFEDFPGLPVIHPVELRADLDELVEDIDEDELPHPDSKNRVRRMANEFVHDWQAAWMVHGVRSTGLARYEALRDAFRESLERLPGPLPLASNAYSFKRAALYTLQAAINPANFVEDTPGATTVASPVRKGPGFDRPVFIVAAPRSGSTLLFEMLALNREFWSVGDESHKHFEAIASLRPSRNNFSNRLTADMAAPDVVETLKRFFVADLVNVDGHSFDHIGARSRPERVRFLEKTPKNALRIPFILEAFPDARFIFLFRDARQNISSLLDSWRSGKFVTYPELPGWQGELRWSHLLIPGWQKLINLPLAQITATQWAVTNQLILGDLRKLPAERWCAVEYDTLLSDPLNELKRLCQFSQVVFGPRMREVATQPLKLSKHTLTAPHPDKWKKNAAELEPVVPATGQLMRALRELV
jgi:hypothetical protein